MRYAILFILLTFLTVSESRAQHYYYMPNSAQIVGFKNKNEASVKAGWSRGSGAKATEFQGAYSPLKRVAVMAGYMSAGDHAVLKNTQEGLNFRFYEIGAGVYEVLPRGTASLMVGYGHGDMYNFFQGEDYADLNLNKIFIQPGILYTDDFFQAGFCIRLSRIKYGSGRVAVSIPEAELTAIENIENKSPLFLPEVGINGGMRFGPLTLTVNVCGIFPRTDNLNFVRLNSCLFAGLELKKGMFKRKNKTEAAPANQG